MALSKLQINDVHSCSYTFLREQRYETYEKETK